MPVSMRDSAALQSAGEVRATVRTLAEEEIPRDPYAGSPKVSVNMRATKALWDRLGDVVRQLDAEGTRASRTELTEALWHFHAPTDPEEARDLLRRYRVARLG